MENTTPNIVLDRDMFIVIRDGEPINITKAEFEILDCLLTNRGKVCTRNSLENRLYGVNVSSSRMVDVYIGYLRKKLGTDFIKTRRQFGYYIEA